MTLSDLNEFVRFFLGDLSQETITDVNLNKIIQGVLDSGISENDCQEKYYSTKATLEWLIRYKTSKDEEEIGGLKRRKEKENGVEVEEEYQNQSTGESSWSKLLSDLVKDPNSIGCKPFPYNVNPNKNVIIGGADINGYEASLQSRNNFDQARYEYRSSGLSPWRPRR